MRWDWIRKSDQEPLSSIESGGVLMLEFPALNETGMVKHAFSTRIGGVSKPPFDTLNFTMARGDNPDHVSENYRRMADAMGVDVNRMVVSWQTHTTNVRVVTDKDAGKGLLKERDYRDIDGLVTNVPGLTLVTFYADCVPLYFVDPVNKAIGLSHSGWRGTKDRMGAKTIAVMQENFGTRPEDVIAAIGPSICQDCFEVGEEVATEFDPSLSYQKPNGKYQLDLWRANRMILESCGVPNEQIHTTDICTHCNPDLLFSHRSRGDQRGNLAAFMTIR